MRGWRVAPCSRNGWSCRGRALPTVRQAHGHETVTIRPVGDPHRVGEPLVLAKVSGWELTSELELGRVEMEDPAVARAQVEAVHSTDGG